MIIRNIFYAILLGAGMAACLSQNDKDEGDKSTGTALEQPETETTAQPLTPTAEQLQILPEKVGFISIGDDIEQMRQSIPAGFTIQDTTLQQEGTEATAYIIRPEAHSKGFLVEQQCNPACAVWRFNVQSDKYKTAKGIAVGTTYKQVQQAHPISTVTLGDAGLVAVAKDGGISFILDEDKIPANKLSRLTPETVPAATQVKAILIY
ncbi:mechanosensitive ion channel protein MscS [Pontibacter sp. H259]|uniref:mechanosensitive ion channel protein MscS n=1 Tax=Pontibacter sp. H259 TaxID=3133421 RepID=UPI0030C4B360